MTGVFQIVIIYSKKVSLFLRIAAHSSSTDTECTTTHSREEQSSRGEKEPKRRQTESLCVLLYSLLCDALEHIFCTLIMHDDHNNITII